MDMIKNQKSFESEEEINLIFLFNILIRNKKIILIFTIISIFFSFLIEKVSKKFWQGQFQIVLRKDKEANSILSKINTSLIPSFANIEDL